MRLLDLFCGRWGWSKAFAARNWECVGVDLVEPPEVPPGCVFFQMDIFELDESLQMGRLPFSEGWRYDVSQFDFICGSSPCEQFALFGLKCFHPNPPYPELGIRLFNHARGLCEETRLPYILENVRSAEQFVGKASARCGPFAMWGPGVPPILPQGIKKGMGIGNGAAVKGMTQAERKAYRKQFPALQMGGKSEKRKSETATWATIPPELANCVADYAERILELGTQKAPEGR